MEACLLITKTNKEKPKKGKVLFINAVQEVKQEKTMGFLKKEHIDKIFKAYKNFKDEKDFASLKTTTEVLKNSGNMAISLYVQPEKLNKVEILDFEDAFENWEDSSNELKNSMNELFQTLEN